MYMKITTNQAQKDYSFLGKIKTSIQSKLVEDVEQSLYKGYTCVSKILTLVHW